MKIALTDLTLDELQKIVTEEFHEPVFRAAQIFEWLNKGTDIADMRNIPITFREMLDAKYTLSDLTIEKKLTEKKSNTVKYLLKTKDDIIIECVILSYAHGNTICVSSQAGCSMRCGFCASGKNGLLRNLTASEMISQLICAIADSKERIANIVMMGSGEPLDNYDEVKKFIQAVNQPKGLNIGIRHITLSTCGIIPGIKRLIQDQLFINLSVSMHSPISAMRAEMMPVEKAYPIKKVVEVCNEYRNASGRRITYEYSVIEGLNDTDICADGIRDLVAKSDAHVNLININEGSGAYGRNSEKAVYEFEKKLTARKINCTIRRKLGSSINAACGQLKSEYLNK